MKINTRMGKLCGTAKAKNALVTENFRHPDLVDSPSIPRGKLILFGNLLNCWRPNRVMVTHWNLQTVSFGIISLILDPDQYLSTIFVWHCMELRETKQTKFWWLVENSRRPPRQKFCRSVSEARGGSQGHKLDMFLVNFGRKIIMTKWMNTFILCWFLIILGTWNIVKLRRELKSA